MTPSDHGPDDVRDVDVELIDGEYDGLRATDAETGDVVIELRFESDIEDPIGMLFTAIMDDVEDVDELDSGEEVMEEAVEEAIGEIESFFGLGGSQFRVDDDEELW